MFISFYDDTKGYNPPKQAANLEKNVQTANIIFLLDIGSNLQNFRYICHDIFKSKCPY